MLSTVSSFSTPKFAAPPGLPAYSCLKPQHHHHDCYTPGHAQPEIYNRSMGASPLALTNLQMGDNLVLQSFPSAQFTIGDEPAGQQTQWTADLGEIPKDCYYCRNNGGTITGKCSNDDGTWGSGKDYMGNDCSSCGGTGVCSHCGGDGIIGT